MKKSKCNYGCGRNVAYTQLGICHACYQGIYYWKAKTTKQIINRQQQYEVFARRISTVIGDKIVPLRRKRTG